MQVAGVEEETECARNARLRSAMTARSADRLQNTRSWTMARQCFRTVSAICP